MGRIKYSRHHCSTSTRKEKVINVVNKYKHAPTGNDLYIGRGSVMGNPYTSKPVEKTKAQFQADDVMDSIMKYEAYLKQEIMKGNKQITEVINTLIEIEEMGETVNLVCFCAPRPCHGNVIKDLVLGIIKERKKHE